MLRYYRKLRRQGKLLSLRMTEGAVFLRRFVEFPRQVGSVMPSSRYLTRAVMDKIDWEKTRCLAELGAGTGVFTRSILRNLRKSGEALVFEIDPMLKRMIEDEHSGLNVHGDARELPKILLERGIPELDCVVSSLPFAVLPPRMTASILDAVCKCLKPGGKMVAYQYSRHMKPYFEKRFANVKTSFVLRNVPPAFVYECVKGA
ncbi:MAG: methyltransferase domain-containing protein [Synergistaceae bacterium]|nr:methyltransferase domain-containing protein [Synergistaceae bacterium]